MISIYLKFIALLATVIFPLAAAAYFSTLGAPESENYKQLFKRLKGSRHVGARAQDMIRQILNGFHRFFEQDKTFNATQIKRKRDYWSPAALNRCLLLAVVYPILSALIIWLLTGRAGDIGAILGLTDNHNILWRLSLFIWLIISSISFLKFLKSEGRRSILYLSLIHI